MTPEIQAMPFDELRTLHREIGALIAEKRAQALEQLREQASILGFTPDDLIPKKKSNSGAAKYRDPDTGNTYSGRGKHPQWLKDKLEAGASLEDFAIN